MREGRGPAGEDLDPPPPALAGTHFGLARTRPSTSPCRSASVRTPLAASAGQVPSGRSTRRPAQSWAGLSLKMSSVEPMLDRRVLAIDLSCLVLHTLIPAGEVYSSLPARTSGPSSVLNEWACMSTTCRLSFAG